MVKLQQQSTFWRHAAKVLSPFTICAVFDVPLVIAPLSGVINYVFCIYYSTTTNTNIKN